MNWTGGGLTRVGTTKRNAISQKQKAHFARARNAARSRLSTSLHDDRPTKSHMPQSQSHDRERHNRSTNNMRDIPGAVAAQPVLFGGMDRDEYRLLARKQELLRKSDWTNVRAIKPGRLSGARDDTDKDNFGRRRKIVKRSRLESTKQTSRVIQPRQVNNVSHMWAPSTESGNFRVAIGTEAITTQTQRTRLPLTDSIAVQDRSAVSVCSLSEESMLLDDNDEEQPSLSRLTIALQQKQTPPLQITQPTLTPVTQAISSDLIPRTVDTFGQSIPLSNSLMEQQLCMLNTGRADSNANTSVMNHGKMYGHLQTEAIRSVIATTPAAVQPTSSFQADSTRTYAPVAKMIPDLRNTQFATSQRPSSRFDQRSSNAQDMTTYEPFLNGLQAIIAPDSGKAEKTSNRLRAGQEALTISDDDRAWRIFIIGDVLGDMSETSSLTTTFDISDSSTPIAEPWTTDDSLILTDRATYDPSQFHSRGVAT